MFKRMIANKKNFILILMIDLLAIACILFLMNHVQTLLNHDLRINLSEIVTQNKNVITGKLDLALSAMELDAKLISEKLVSASTTDSDALQEVFNDYTTKKNDRTLVYSDIYGQAISANGVEFDISGRAYFKLGIKGTPAISERVISRENGKEVFIFCVPLVHENKILGTIQKQYTPSEMYALCAASLFSKEGYTYVISSSGQILISSANDDHSNESVNFYDTISQASKEASKKLEADIRANKSGFLETKLDNERVFFTYTPIEQIHDWFLISSIPTSTVSPNANVVISIFYSILFAITLVFTFSIVYFLWMKRKQHKALEKIAFVDDVTGGDSFTKFTVELESIVMEQTVWPLYICAFDIDNFKYINSFYSFEAGNVVLQEIHRFYSERLYSNELISRMTADKFVMLLTDVSEERMSKLLELEMNIDGIRIYLSAGLYRIPDMPQSVGLMVDKAQMAAQNIKGQHFKHVALYSDNLDEENSHTEQIKRALEKALQFGEIIPYFQPKVNINTGALIGAEALARWCKTDGELICPAEFIPICEKTGLISLVDMTIFEQTLKFVQSNLAANVKCTPISINFSRLHLLNESFVDKIVSLLNQYNVPSHLIEIELTETVIFENSQTITAFIDALHQNGLSVSMDDFGSGYSSLHMLKDTEIDVLKIDRGFLLDTASSRRQRIIFGAIIHMAQQLDIEVIVEGVETDENVALLKEFGCANAQGFYFARPMSKTAFENIYREGFL